MRGVPRERFAISRAPSSVIATFITQEPHAHNIQQFFIRIKIKANGNSKTVTQRRRQ